MEHSLQNVTTYGEIAKYLDVCPYQAIGSTLKCKSYIGDVPYHCVICSEGCVGGYLGSLGSEKGELLESLGVVVSSGKIDLKRFDFSFSNTQSI